MLATQRRAAAARQDGGRHHAGPGRRLGNSNPLLNGGPPTLRVRRVRCPATAEAPGGVLFPMLRHDETDFTVRPGTELGRMAAPLIVEWYELGATEMLGRGL